MRVGLSWDREDLAPRFSLQGGAAHVQTGQPGTVWAEEGTVWEGGGEEEEQSGQQESDLLSLRLQAQCLGEVGGLGLFALSPTAAASQTRLQPVHGLKPLVIEQRKFMLLLQLCCQK